MDVTRPSLIRLIASSLAMHDPICTGGWPAGLLGVLAALLLSGTGARAQRTTVPLDGTWQLAEGIIGEMPARFDRTVPVPGLVEMAQPAYDPAVFFNKKRRFGPEDATLAKRSYWYRRQFKIEGAVPQVAMLGVRKACFGSTIYLNGVKVGESLDSFTPNHYDLRAALRGNGENNELVIRVGGSRASLPPTVPTGADFEKKSYIPGIFDSVDLVLSGTPHIVTVQAVPEIAGQTVRIQARVRNVGTAKAPADMTFTVRESKSGKIVGQTTARSGDLPPGSEQTVEARIPIAGCRLWSPEDPFLYTLESRTAADSLDTRFGMREFHFTPRTGDQPGRAWLNGKPYFMRGSNVTLYRFFEDPQRAALPWNEEWVRLLHRRFKGMHWNSLRYCIGFPPEFWYRIADEEGFLIQDEFPIWEGPWPPELKSDALIPPFTAWMRERWNHPCVVIWDAQNESVTTETGAALMAVRGLDLSNRPWDNGWSRRMADTDPSEIHPYHFVDPLMTLSKAMADPIGMPTDTGKSNPGDRNCFIINEYGWLWLNRNGTPTTLTQKLYANLAGKDAPPATLYPLAARLLAAETEFWRCRRQAAGVLHFCGLGYSRPDGQTSDHWLDITTLKWEPEFYQHVRNAFAPVGLMVDWAVEKVARDAAPKTIPVVVINDLAQPYRGPVTLRVKRGTTLLGETRQPCQVEPFGRTVVQCEVIWPEQDGRYTLEAELSGADGSAVRSRRDTEITADAKR